MNWLLAKLKKKAEPEKKKGPPDFPVQGPLEGEEAKKANQALRDRLFTPTGKGAKE